jgi:hypothetical protein
VSQEDLEPVQNPGRNGTPVMNRDAPDDAATEIALLSEENQRLQREYEQFRQQATSKRWSKIALGLLVLASVDVLVAAYFYPALETQLLTLGGAGLFLSLLVVALRPGRTAELDESVFGTASQNCAAMASELGLAGDHVFVPTEDNSSARLYAPTRPDFDLQQYDSVSDLQSDLQRDLALVPTGVPLFYRYEEFRAGSLPADAAELAGSLCEALADGFEIADDARSVVDAYDGRATVRFDGTAYGSVDQFDHPARSFVGVGLAVGLETPVVLDSVTRTDDGGYEVVYRWTRR